MNLEKKYNPANLDKPISTFFATKIHSILTNTIQFKKLNIKRQAWPVTESYSLDINQPVRFIKNKKRIIINLPFSNFINFLLIKKKKNFSFRTKPRSTKKWLKTIRYYPKSAPKRVTFFTRVCVRVGFLKKMMGGYRALKKIAMANKKLLKKLNKKSLKPDIESLLKSNHKLKPFLQKKKTKLNRIVRVKIKKILRKYKKLMYLTRRKVRKVKKLRANYFRKYRFLIFNKKKPKYIPGAPTYVASANKRRRRPRANLPLPFPKTTRKRPRRYHDMSHWLYFNNSFHMVSTKFFFQSSNLNIVFQFLNYKNLLLYLYEDFGKVLKIFFKPYMIKRYFKRYEKEIRYRYKKIKYYRIPAYKWHDTLRKRRGFAYSYLKKRRRKTRQHVVSLYKRLRNNYFKINKYTYSKKEKKVFLLRSMNDITMDFNYLNDTYISFEYLFDFNFGVEEIITVDYYVSFYSNKIAVRFEGDIFSKKKSILDKWIGSIFSKFPPYLIENSGKVKRRTDLEKVIYDLDYPEALKNYVPDYKFD